MATVMAWFANKLVVLVVCGLALVGVVAGPIAAYEAVEINGIHLGIFGWNVAIVTGLRQEAADATANYNTCKANRVTLQSVLDRQNGQIDDLNKSWSKNLAAAHDDVATAQANAAKKAAALAIFMAQKPAGATTCLKYDDVDRRFMELLK